VDPYRFTESRLDFCSTVARSSLTYLASAAESIREMLKGVLRADEGAVTVTAEIFIVSSVKISCAAVSGMKKRDSAAITAAVLERHVTLRTI
jgi:hypothetical protein